MLLRFSKLFSKSRTTFRDISAAEGRGADSHSSIAPRPQSAYLKERKLLGTLNWAGFSKDGGKIVSLGRNAHFCTVEYLSTSFISHFLPLLGTLSPTSDASFPDERGRFSSSFSSTTNDATTSRDTPPKSERGVGTGRRIAQGMEMG